MIRLIWFLIRARLNRHRTCPECGDVLVYEKKLRVPEAYMSIIKLWFCLSCNFMDCKLKRGANPRWTRSDIAARKTAEFILKRRNEYAA